MKTEPQSNGEEVNKFGNPGFVTSLILDEIESNPIDLITVICKVNLFIFLSGMYIFFVCNLIGGNI